MLFSRERSVPVPIGPGRHDRHGPGRQPRQCAGHPLQRSLGRLGWPTPTRSASTRSRPGSTPSSSTPWPRPTPTGCTTDHGRSRRPDGLWRKHPARRFFAQLQLQRGRRLGRPAGELCELLGRGPVCQLAPQRSAHRAAGAGNDRGWRVSRYRQPDAVRTQRRTRKFFIPTEDEWYKAAYHDKTAGLAASYFDYPTGTNSVPGNDITETTNPGNNANYYISNYAIGSPYYRTAVGEFELSDSPYGTFDQGGNVWEWNETAVTSSSRGLRGGSFERPLAHPARGRQHRYDPTVGRHIGFRVASVPEPSTLLLVAMATFGLLPRRKR